MLILPVAEGATSPPSELTSRSAYWFDPSDLSAATPLAVGMVNCAPDSFSFRLFHWDDPKKNSLLRIAGPPTSKPNSLSTYCGVVVMPWFFNSTGIAVRAEAS